MPASDAIRATLQAGGSMTSQAVADFAKQSYDDMLRSLRAGRLREAREHEAEFERLCELFQKV